MHLHLPRLRRRGAKRSAETSAGSTPVSALDRAALEASLETAQADVTRLRAELAETQTESGTRLEAFRAERAAFAQYRRRTTQDREAARDQADARLLVRIFDLADDFARARAHRPSDLGPNGWIDGLVAIERKVADILESSEIETVDASPGRTFDPAEHEAIAMVSDTGRAEGQIVEEHRRGYRRRGHLLRTALVTVAGAPETVLEMPAPTTKHRETARRPRRPSSTRKASSPKR